MRHLIFFNSEQHHYNLKPLTLTRPLADLRIGILKISEKWAVDLRSQSTAYYTQGYLTSKFKFETKRDNFLINASILPHTSLVGKVKRLKNQQALLHNGQLIAARIDQELFDKLDNEIEIDQLTGFEVGSQEIKQLNNLWDILNYNADEIRNDFSRLTPNRYSQELHPTNVHHGQYPLFVADGAHVRSTNFDTTQGPIYIGENSTILAGANIMGPVAILDSAVIKMGANLYEGTTIGVKATVGGELKNAILGDYSNKGHSGYLGDSVIGNWCNFGANTNVSNLKNTYSPVRLWNYKEKSFVNTGTKKCGSFVGDFVRTGISTMLNTGTVIGTCCNIYGGEFPSKYIPSFSWGMTPNSELYDIEKALPTIQIMMDHKGEKLTEEEINILRHLHKDSSSE